MAELSPHVLHALNVNLSSSTLDIDNACCAQLKHLLEVSDYGDDLLLCRFDYDKALYWLVQKFNKAKEVTPRLISLISTTEQTIQKPSVSANPSAVITDVAVDTNDGAGCKLNM